jgi:hypothetical protein
MDAYSSYILRISEARVGELRREAEEYALSRAARPTRRSLWSRCRDRLVGARPAHVEPVTPVALPVEPASDTDLRRSA